MNPKKAKREAAPFDLVACCLYGRWKLLKQQIENGMDPNTIVKNGAPLLHYAVTFVNAEMVDYLIKKGANPMFANSKGETPLHFAFLCQSKEIVNLLIANGAYVTNTKPTFGCPAGETPMDMLWAANRSQVSGIPSQVFYLDMLKLGFEMNPAGVTYLVEADEEFKEYKRRLLLPLCREHCPGSLFDPEYLPWDLFNLIRDAINEAENN